MLGNNIYFSMTKAPVDFKHSVTLQLQVIQCSDFTFYTQFDEKQACSPGFMGMFLESCRAAVPFMKFLADALKLEW